MTHDLELALRESFASDADSVTGPADPWSSFSGREARHRRNRRVRAVVVAGVLGAVVGVQSNLVPLPGWAPGIAVAGRSPQFLDVPTRGSLAGDLAWQAGLRQQAPDLAEREGLWKVTDREDMHIIYAGDIPGRRLAVALVKFRLGIVTSWSQMYFDGPVGAAPEQMVEAGYEDVDVPVLTWSTGDDVDGGAAIAIGPPGATVSISAGYDYTPAGTIKRRVLSSGQDGVATAVLPPTPRDPDPYAVVTERGKVIFEGSMSTGWSTTRDTTADDVPTAAVLAEAQKGAQGEPIDAATLETFVRSGLDDSQLSAREVTLRVWWSGRVNGQAAALFTLQPKGGGVIAYAMHGEPTAWRTDLRLLLPADGADRRPLAWRMRAEGRDNPTDQVHVVAPRGAARVTITIGANAPVPVSIDASGLGTATVPANQPATVTAVAADGTAIATTPVPPFEKESGGLPGATRGTRIVD
ncbi:hypothetical protein WEI85_17935 [Actinomycetes bacterium KLBMP 9797]